MTLDQAIKALEALRKEHGGDVQVKWHSISHSFSIDPRFSERYGYVVVND